MRITYRNAINKDYWTKRWADIPADDPMENLNAYPLKYAQMTVESDRSGKILEAGCGAGRVLRFYHNRGYDILGIDFIEIAINKLKKTDTTLKAEVGDITNLRFTDNYFQYILAFGLYHNLESGLDNAIKETFRVLKPGGLLCASFRADNIQTRLTDWHAVRKSRLEKDSYRINSFHKMNLTRSEFQRIFANEGFIIQFIESVENMPILYKFSMFRSVQHRVFDENRARSEGYRLSWFGQKLQNFLMYFFPDQFCNIYVLIARKP